MTLTLQAMRFSILLYALFLSAQYIYIEAYIYCALRVQLVRFSFTCK